MPCESVLPASVVECGGAELSCDSHSAERSCVNILYVVYSFGLIFHFSLLLRNWGLERDRETKGSS